MTTAHPRDCGASVAECLPLGSRETVLLDLDAMRRDPGLAPILEAIRPRDLQAFEHTWSFRPDVVHSLAYGRYEPGELVVLEGAFDAGAVVEHVGSRMNTLEIIDSDPPRRVGFLGAARLDIAAVGAHRIAVGREHGAAMMRLLARVRGRPIPAYVDRLAPEARRRLASSPFVAVFAMDGRFPVDTDAGLVLSRVDSVILTLATDSWTNATPVRPGQTLTARLTVHGSLPAGAEQNLRGIVQAVAESEYGGVFGIRDALPTFLIRVDAHGADLVLQLDAAHVASAIPLLSAETSTSQAPAEMRK